MNSYKIALIVAYFGKWPAWFDLYLYSCSRNPGIDFIYYTDCGLPRRVYTNTFFHQCSFQEYCDLVSEKLHIDFHPDNTYKLCDLKPFFGIIHSDILKDYDFWGFADIDLVFGQLNLLVNESNLRRYDVITSHADRIAGHFTLIRNKSQYTRYCLNIDNWESRLSNAENDGMDEFRFTKVVIPWPDYLAKVIWGKLIRRIIPQRQAYHFFYLWNKFSCRLPKRVLMKEMFTTFVPDPSKPCVVDLNTMRVTCPRNQRTWVVGGVLCISTSSFSRKLPIS